MPSESRLKPCSLAVAVPALHLERPRAAQVLGDRVLDVLLAVLEDARPRVVSSRAPAEANDVAQRAVEVVLEARDAVVDDVLHRLAAMPG